MKCSVAFGKGVPDFRKMGLFINGVNNLVRINRGRLTGFQFPVDESIAIAQIEQPFIFN